MAHQSRKGVVEEEAPLFYVKHHADEMAILNAKCPTALLVERLRKLARDIAPDVGVDLIPIGGPAASDHKAPQPLLLGERVDPSNGASAYANTYIVPRAVYVLLTARDDEDGVRVLKPLWTTANDDSAKLAAGLDMRAADERKKIVTKKGSKR